MYISSNFQRLNDDEQRKSLSELLKAYLEENKLSKMSLADILSIDRKTLGKILSGSKEIKLNHALKIMALLNIRDEDFIKTYLKDLGGEELEDIEKTKLASFLIDNFDIETLRTCGIIQSKTDYSKIAEEICQFFGYDDIYEYNDIVHNKILFSKSKIFVGEKKAKKMQTFWVKCAYHSFLKINNPNPYDEILLIEFVKRIKSFTRDTEEGFNKVLLVLYQLGVTVFVQPYMNKTQAYGISMIVNNKPCIIITDLGKKYHKLWQTLLHELYHVINDYEYISSATFHISDPSNEDIFVSERDADAFSQNVLLSEQILPVVRKLIRNPYKINELAHKIDVDPSIIYGIYLETLPKDIAPAEYPKYAKLLKPSESAIKNIIFDPVQYRGIIASVERMKKQFNILTA